MPIRRTILNQMERNRLPPLLLIWANGLCLLLSAAWLLLPPTDSIPLAILWNVYGLLLLFVMVANPLLDPGSEASRKKDWLFLCFHIAVSLAVPVLVTMASLQVSNVSSVSIPARILVLALLSAGAVRATCIRKGTQDGFFQSIPLPRRIPLLAAPLFLLCFGVLVSHSVLAVDKSAILEVFVPEYGFFWATSFLTGSILFIRLNRGVHTRLINGLIVLAGCCLFVICLLPLAMTPFLLRDAARETETAFGTVLMEPASPGIRFRPLRFSVPEYVFGTGNGGYSVQENLEYYRQQRSDGKETVLRFDAYLPTEVPMPPDGYPVLIRIHGGAWTIGDKGAFNYAQEGKYFAGRGYAVFDVQYGLADKKRFVEGVPVSEEVTGPFDIDDMMTQLGAFTRFLADGRTQWKADVSRTFLSGGSAGGQLVCALGLGLADGRYDEWLDSRIKVRGILPYYPALGLSDNLGIGGKAEWVDPTLLVSKKSPPCLIYQGTRDSLVDFSIPLKFRDAYPTTGNKACAVLLMPFASHGSDFHFASNFHQVYLYYMERFMAYYAR